jgi:hypothetical protein
MSEEAPRQGVGKSSLHPRTISRLGCLFDLGARALDGDLRPDLDLITARNWLDANRVACHRIAKSYDSHATESRVSCEPNLALALLSGQQDDGCFAGAPRDPSACWSASVC